MRRGTFVLLFAVLVAVFIFSIYGTAAALDPGTYYVDILNGNDANDGKSPGTGAWKTLHYAMGLINTGTPGPYTLNVASGTYNSTSEGADRDLIISQDNVEIIGETGTMPVLDGSDAGYLGWYDGITIEGSNVIIRDLEIQKFSYEGILAQGQNSITIYNCDVHHNGATGIVIFTEEIVNGGTIKRCEVSYNQTGIGVIDAQNIVIEQNYVHDNKSAALETGIYVSNATTGVEIKKNLVENNDTGIQIYGCSPLVERNEIKDNATGIEIIGESGFPASPKVYNNLIYDTISQMNYGIIVDGSWSTTASPELYHNTIDGGSFYGIDIYGYMGSAEPSILFDIITNFGTYGIYNLDGSPSIDYNDVWNNATANYSGCSAGPNDIIPPQNPLFVASYELESTSPCKDAIPASPPPTNPVIMDLPGYKRPRGSGYDMGAYEYVSDITHNYNLPGGTGQVTDYRMFTLPVYVGTGSIMKSTMESYVGAYDKCEWRVFAYGSGYIEMDAAGFSSLAVGPGDAFWAISLGTDLIPFSGPPAPDGEYYTIPLKPGWNMFGLPWPKGFPDIELGKIAVSDGVNNYWITSGNNTLTQKSVWDYTGIGPSNGYVQLTAATDVLKPGSGYWIKVESTLPAELLIPPDNARGYFSALSLKGYLSPSTSGDSGAEPPPPPGGVSSESTGVENTAKGSCFIATAAYGSRLHPYVKTLRGFRDSYLLSNAPGRKLVALYYRYSPAAANVIADNAPLKYLTRLLLLPLIGLSAFLLYASPVFKCAFLVLLSLVLTRIVLVCVGNKRRCL